MSQYSIRYEWVINWPLTFQSGMICIFMRWFPVQHLWHQSVEDDRLVANIVKDDRLVSNHIKERVYTVLKKLNIFRAVMIFSWITDHPGIETGTFGSVDWRSCALPTELMNQMGIHTDFIIISDVLPHVLHVKFPLIEKSLLLICHKSTLIPTEKLKT